jgi:hypothetical protein
VKLCAGRPFKALTLIAPPAFSSHATFKVEFLRVIQILACTLLKAARMLISSASIFARPVPSTPVVTVMLGADVSVPQAAGTTITWTATPRGGIGPYQYKWLLYNGSEWDVVKNWSGSNIFRWTPAFGNPRYRVSVWVRSAGNAVDDFEATTEAAFAIDEVAGTASLANSPSAMPQGTAALTQPVSTVTLGANPSSPQPPGTTIVWTAAATGGGSGRQYKWFVYDGSSWTIAAPWSTSDTLVWTPITANPRYRIAVWARSAGSLSDYFEACAEVGFAVVES